LEHGNVNIVIRFVKQKMNYKNIFIIIMLKLEKMEEYMLGIKVLQKKPMNV